MNAENSMSLVVDSLMLCLTLTSKAKSNPANSRLMRITGKAWKRHWRRIAKAQAFGFALTIPEGATI